MTAEPQTTSWSRVTAVFLVGVSVAFLIGKVPAALPLLRAELGLSLFQAGLVVSMFTIVTAVTGILFGAFADRFGHVRIAAIGLCFAGASSALGSLAGSAVTLIASRAGEGIGFVLVSVSLPPLLARLARPQDRPKAFGLWGAFVPGGAASMLLISGVVLDDVGWRGMWLAIAASYVFFAALMVWATKPVAARPQATRTTQAGGSFLEVLKVPGPALLAGIFGCYSSLFLVVTAFVPLILVEQAGWSLPAAASAGAAVIAANVVGNLASGFLLSSGLKRAQVIQATALAMALGASLVFIDGLPIWLRIAGGVLFSGVGGAIPGSLFSAVAIHAPTPGHASTVNGLMFQGVSIGQFVGPAITTWVVGLVGTWTGALFYVWPVALLCIALAALLGGVETRRLGDY